MKKQQNATSLCIFLGFFPFFLDKAPKENIREDYRWKSLDILFRQTVSPAIYFKCFSRKPQQQQQQLFIHSCTYIYE